MSAAAAFAVFAASLLAVAGWLVAPWALTALRRSRVRRQPFPAEWRELLRRRMPYFRQLPADLQLQLKKHTQVLLAEVPFIGCADLVVTTEMRVLIAAQAALLLLNRRSGSFRNLRQVLVYPGAFVVDRPVADGHGITQDQRRALAGESWQQGQVILSWQDVLEGAAAPDDGHNVVIHEFAHQLDQETGPANGAPWLPGRAARDRWARTLSAEFAALHERLARGETGLIDVYGATDPAEFFAVVSELFFERPSVLAADHPALYRELTVCYRTDPLSW
ncbi:MAG: zinc-dependent peptidase [Chitinophagaceae bacterium]|nr:zinc-dependent peptidase [Rubrivivax sp.]